MLENDLKKILYVCDDNSFKVLVNLLFSYSLVRLSLD